MTRSDIERLAGAVLLPGFAGPACPDWLADELADGLAGVCLFASNIESLGQLASLTAAMRSFGDEPVIAVDEEGGDVSRLHAATGSPAAGNAHLGRIDDVTLTENTMTAIGSELSELGITMDLAPVADINSNPLNPVIGVRSFGTDPELVSRHVAAAIRGLQGAGVGAVAKHFPGHGDTTVDSHVGLPTLDVGLPDLTARELRPFAAAIDAGVAAIMTAHLVVPALDPLRPASLSPASTALLRDRLGFRGLIVTDALDMQGASGGGTGMAEAAVRALEAGAQLLCLGTDTTPAQLDAIRSAVADAVDSGRLSRQTIDDAAVAVQEFRRRFSTRAGGGPDATTAGYPALDGSGGLLIARPVPAQLRPLVIRLHGSFNHAAGRVPWGLGEHLRPELDALLTGVQLHDVGDIPALGRTLAAASTRPGGCVVVGRNIGRSNFQTAAVAMIRSRMPAAVVVEMGWPTGTDGWDIASYGAGRAVSLAVAGALGQGVAP